MAGSIGPGYPWCRADRVPNVVERSRRREMDHALARLGLTTPQEAALSVLANHPGVSRKDERLHALGDFEVMAIEETMLVQFPAKGRRNCPKC